MCQGKHSGNAIDIPVRCKVTEDCFQMKLASLKRYNYLDTESRNIETKLFSVSQLILNRLQGTADESADKELQPFKASTPHHKFHEMNATSVHSVFNHS